MCGISGFIDFGRKAGEAELRSMTDCLSYRGPDDSGYAVIKSDRSHVGLGHRRLSIIDLSPLGHQPMYSRDGKRAIVFNGEVYNYAEIREELLTRGHSFVSGSDTEVILAAYIEWGADAVHKFIGMFALAIWDGVLNRVFILRDRAGVKPLYYYHYGDLLLFGSELKSFFKFPGFEKQINPSSFYNFLQYSFVPAPYTIFKETWKLEPGHYLMVNLETTTVHNVPYWNVLDYYAQEKLDISEDEAMNELEARLRKACEYRMVSDVPVGLFLSGGYDSSLVAAMLQTGRSSKIKTFTIGFPDKKYDEAGHAKKVANHLGTEHHELYCTYEEAKSIIPELPYYYDEPFGDSSAIPTILVSRFAAKSVKVALSADGGDEIFAGYERHAALMNLSSKLNSVPGIARKPLAFMVKNLPGFVWKKMVSEKNISQENINKYASFIAGSADVVDMIDYANQTVMPEYTQAFTDSRSSNGSSNLFDKNAIRNMPGNLDRLLAFDYLSYLPNDILTKVDRATMSVSIEGREPLLDQNIIEWVARLPDHFKYNKGVSKYILRKVVHKYVPREIMNRPKMGFAVPLVDWFRADLKYLFDTHLNKDSLEKHGLIKHQRLEQELSAYYAGNNFRFSLLWNFLMFQLWYERWM